MTRTLTLASAALLTTLILPLGGCTKAKTAEVVQRDEAAPVDIHVAAVRKIIRPAELVLDGTLLADEESRVTSVVSGRVVEVFVERGSKVEADAPLIRLRDVDYELAAKAARDQLAQARARLGIKGNGGAPSPETLPDVQAAKAEAKLAQSELERSEQLVTSGAVSASDLDQLRTRAASAQDRYQSALNSARAQVAAVSSAKTSLEQAQTQRDEALVRAPFAGEIADRLVSVGEYVSPQTPLVHLVRVQPLRIELAVPQQHLQQVQPGQKVTLRVDAIAERTFEATVRYVSASVERNTRALTVEAVVPNDDGMLRPGLFATARLQTGERQTVSELPAEAVRTAAGVSRVFVVNGSSITERVVSIADRVGDRIIIAEGLGEGERVAIDSFDKLGDGVAVNVLDAE